MQLIAEHFEPDIIARVQRDFGADADSVFEQLLTFRRERQDLATPRIIRCIVHAAHECPAYVADFVQLAKTDYRDLIMVAEYRMRPGTKSWQDFEHIHDFNLPFTNDQSSGG